MYLQAIYDILVVEKIRKKNPSDKGKPSERVGHKALEPTRPKGLMAVSYREGKKLKT